MLRQKRKVISPNTLGYRRNKAIIKLSQDQKPDWTFLTNHAHVFLCIADEPNMLMRDVSRRVGITERAVQRIVVDLEKAGYLKRIRHGRRNHYVVHDDLPFRHPIEKHERVSSLIALILDK